MPERSSDDGMKTIVIALVVNLVVAAIKAVAGVLSASAGLLAEAAHSVADCTTELFLVTACAGPTSRPTGNTLSGTARSATSGRCWPR